MQNFNMEVAPALTDIYSFACQLETSTVFNSVIEILSSAVAA